jgi:hypothetical protein
VSDALRELIASFVVEVDKAGELAKGNAAVDLLKERLTELQDSFKKIKAPAEQASKAIEDVFARAAQTAKKNLQAIASINAFGSGKAETTGWGDAFAGAAARAQAAMPQYGPTRETLQAHQRSEFVADAHPGQQFGPTRETMVAGRAAAEAYAQTLRGKLESAVAAVRAGFNGGGGKGPGLIASLATVRNGFLALGAGFAVRGVKHLVDSIGDISEGAARLGVTTDEFQRMSTYARQNATDVGTLGTAFRTLATSAVDPTTETTAAFAELGVETTNTAGQFKSSQQLFFEVGEALAGVSNETVRTQLAQKLLGRSAMELKPMFAQGTEAFRKQREEMLKLKVLSPELIKSADDMSDSWVVLSAQLMATAGPVLQDTVFPALKSLTEGLSGGVEWLGKMIAKTDLTGVAIAALATGAGWLTFVVIPPLIAGLGGVSAALGVIAAEVVAITWPILAAVAAFAALYDIVRAIRGKSSYTGDAVAALGKASGTMGFQPGAFMADTGGLLGQPTIPAPGGGARYGDAAASSSVINANGDRNVTVNMAAGASPGDVGRVVGTELERDRNSIVAPVP